MARCRYRLVADEEAELIVAPAERVTRVTASLGEIKPAAVAAQITTIAAVFSKQRNLADVAPAADGRLLSGPLPARPKGQAEEGARCARKHHTLAALGCSTRGNVRIRDWDC